MYEYIKGTVTMITPGYIVVENQGVGYKILVPNPYSFHQEEAVQIYIEMIVREDSHTLYGFLQKEEKEIFQALLQVSGIGPKSALAIMAFGDLNGLVAALEEENITYLTRFPGVGKKTAQQMILDLNGKLLPKEEVKAPVSASPVVEEATSALQALGYSEKEVARVMKKMKDETFTDVQDCISQALRLMVER